MNKLLLLSLCTAASLSAVAQPTITSAILPIGGDMEVGMQTMMLTSPGPAGANVNWDFSNVSFSPGDTTIYYICPGAPGCSQFPGSTLAANNPVDDFYTHYAAGTQKYTALGYYDVTDDYVFDDPEDLLRFPMTYTNSYTDSFNVLFDYAANFVVRRKGQIVVTADGYGTLKLPNGTYNNVLRVKAVEDFSDSSGGTPLVFHIEQYAWYDPTLRSPLITFSVFSSPAAPMPQYYAQYRSNIPTAVAQTALQSGSIGLYPNPATDVLTLTLPTAIDASRAAISVSDVTGRSMPVAISATGHTATIQVTTLPAGLYLMQVRTPLGSRTLKFEKL